MEELSRRIASADEMSGQMYELRCHLQGVQQKLRHRDAAIDKALSTQTTNELEHASLRQQIRAAEGRIKTSDSSEQAGGGSEGNDEWTFVEPAGTEPLAEAPQARFESIGVQAGDDDARGCGDQLDELRRRVDAHREEKCASERQTSEELKKLRAQVRGQTSTRRKAEAVADDLPYEVQSADPTGLLYVRKVAELEALCSGLEHDIDLLQSSEQVLQEDTTEKQELIRTLMRNAHALSQNARENARRSSKSGSVLRGIKKALGAGDSQKAHIQELERAAEEAILDNMRLRKDLRGIGEEVLKLRLSQDREAASEAT